MIEMKPLSGRRRAYDRILRFLLYFCAALTCALLVAIIGYIFVRGLPHVTWDFLTTAVASEMAYASGLQRQALYSIALVLFIFIMIINIVLNTLLKRKKG